MLLKERQAEFESKFIVNVNEKQLEMKFRYFSPSQNQNTEKSRIIQKVERSDELNIVSQMPSPSSSSIREELIIKDNFIEDRRELSPKKQSDKFYHDKISEISHCLLDYYEKFHTKLLIRIKEPQKNTSKKKLEVTSKSKQRDQRPYVKRIKINLFQTHENEKPSKQKTRSEKENECNWQYTKKDNLHHSQQIQAKDETLLRNSNKFLQTRRQRNSFVIKLYEDRKPSLQNMNQDQFKTPRRTYSRKGITVYSSTSLKKHSTGQKCTFSMNTIPNISTNNEQKIESIPTHKLKDRKRQTSIKKKEHKENEVVRKGLRQRYGTEYVEEIKKRAQQTKKRVFSKSKIEKKANPLIRRK